MIDVKVVLAAAVLAGGSVSCGRGGSSGAFDSAYALGERTSELTLEASQADREILEELELEPVAYRRVEDLATTPSLAAVCGVKYRVSSDRWGLVPDLTYPCDDDPAEEQALEDARTRLEAQLGLPESDYELRLRALREPADALTSTGPRLAYARAVGVELDLDSCVERVSDRLGDSLAAASALQCETFLDPGPLLTQFRKQLTDAAELAETLGTVAAVQAPVAITPDLAARCQAQAGTPGLEVPGSVSGVLASSNAAHAIRLEAGQMVEISLSSDYFDSLLHLYDATCSVLLATNDDGGGGNRSLLQWTSPEGGDHVVIVTSFGAQGRGPYDLAVAGASTAPTLSPERRAALQELVQWVKGASEEEILAAWRGSGPAELQMGCLARERFQSAAGARAAVSGEAVSACMEALNEATEARKALLQGED